MSQKSRSIWGKPIFVGLLLLGGGIRIPEILMEGGWRAWGVIPALIGLLWYFVIELRIALRRHAARSAASDDKND
jgi:hypothetical protein